MWWHAKGQCRASTSATLTSESGNRGGFLDRKRKKRKRTDSKAKKLTAEKRSNDE